MTYPKFKTSSLEPPLILIQNVSCYLTAAATNQPLLEVATHSPSNEPAKNLNKVPTGSEETKWSLLNHHPLESNSDSDHAKDLETLQSKNKEVENKAVKSSEEAVGSTVGSSSSAGSLVFGIILAMILISSVLFVGVKKLEAIRRRREYRWVFNIRILYLFQSSLFFTLSVCLYTSKYLLSKKTLHFEIPSTFQKKWVGFKTEAIKKIALKFINPFTLFQANE